MQRLAQRPSPGPAASTVVVEIVDASEAYIRPGAVFPMRDLPPGLVIHVTVDRIYGVGPWVESAH